MALLAKTGSLIMKIVGAAIVVIVCFLIFSKVISVAIPETAHVHLINQTGAEIIEGSIRISSRSDSSVFQNLRPNESRDFMFENFIDGSYDISILLSDGRRFQASEGYVTHNVSFIDTLELFAVQDTVRIRIKQSIKQ